jgi:glucose-6-phosphate isomerase
MSNEILTDRPEFRALQEHYKNVSPLHMRDLFAKEPARFDRFHVKNGGILLDFSKHRATEKTFELLMSLAKVCNIEDWRGKMFAGQPINNTENRAVLHVALRGSVDKNLSVDGENVSKFVDDILKKVKLFSDKIRADKKITDIVNIGIGGSGIGAYTVCKALASYNDGPTVHFVSNIDNAALDPLLKKLKLENTLFIIVSKTFTTLETLSNAEKAKTWAGSNTNFVAVTENVEQAKNFGVRPENIFPMRKWIGGRISIWGAAGLAVAIAAGFDNFQKFLNGAKEMDTHFRTAPLDKNMPVILAMLGVWYRNFFDFRAHTLNPYANDLQLLPTWLQQIDMESNGKNISRGGDTLNYSTGPTIFGGTGTDTQHAFFQSLHQGTDIIPCDFILVNDPANIPLNANALAQAKTLMKGFSSKTEPHRNHPGNRPSSTIILDKLDPFHLGQLMALYEHKIFVQGIVWNINSYDQWGVELGKILSKDITQALESKREVGDYDSSTLGLMHHLKSRAS